MNIKYIRRKSFSFNCSLNEGKKAKYYTGYAVIPVDTFKSANTYRKYVQWDAVQSEDAYNRYTQDGDRFYFCLKGGFEFIKEDDSAYALSMIAVRIDITGELTGVYPRDMDFLDGEGDLELKSPEALEKILNMSFSKTFKPYPMYDAVKRGVIRKLLDSGVSPLELYDFDDITRFSNYTLVRLNGKYNILTSTCRFASPDMWFDRFNWSGRSSDYIISERYRRGKYGFLFKFTTAPGNVIYTDIYVVDEDGSLLSHQPFAACEERGDFLFVKKRNHGWTIMNDRGDLIYPNQEFDGFERQNDAFILVIKRTQGGKQSNIVDNTGHLISPDWYDNIYLSREGVKCAVVCEKDYNNATFKYNYIDENGRLMSPDWFDEYKIGYNDENIVYFKKGDKQYKLDLRSGDFTDITGNSRYSLIFR